MTSPRAGGPIAMVLFLIIRGLALWLIVPLGFVGWILASPWLMPRRVSLGKFLGWVDLNFAAFLQRGLLRPGFRHPAVDWVPASDIGAVNHRIHLLDFA